MKQYDFMSNVKKHHDIMSCKMKTMYMMNVIFLV